MPQGQRFTQILLEPPLLTFVHLFNPFLHHPHGITNPIVIVKAMNTIDHIGSYSSMVRTVTSQYDLSISESAMFTWQEIQWQIFLTCNQLPYSGKFSQGRNFCDFCDPTASPKNLSTRKFVRVKNQTKIRTTSSYKHRTDCRNPSRNMTNNRFAFHHHHCKWVFGIRSLPLAYQFFPYYSFPNAVISMVASYHRIDAKLHAEFPSSLHFRVGTRVKL